MGSQKSLNLCYPRGARLVCLCDIHRRFLKCWSESNAPSDLGSIDVDLGGEALLSRDGDSIFDDDEMLNGLDDLGSAASRRRRGLDERTEIILAATFLVLVILAFVRYVRN